MARALVKEIKDARKNYIINGDMRIAQRGTSFPTAATGTYGVDRFQYIKQGAMVHTVSQDTDVPTLAEAGYLFQNSLRLTLTTPDTSIAATDYNFIRQKIEGFNWANLAQKPFTVSFWVKATLPGTYCVSLANSINDRSLIYEYTINAANTWEYKTITSIASPVSGTWDYATGIGLSVCWVLSSGSNFQTASGSWQSGDFLSTANQINGTNTGATEFRITGVVVNEGTSASKFSLFGTDIQTEFAACQRYYEFGSYNYKSGVSNASIVGSVYTQVCFAVRKRVAPIVVSTNVQGGTPDATNITEDQFMVGRSNVVAIRDNSGSYTADAEL